jgi:hypothetical protein
MSDPRLNSVHLEGPRLDLFRRAREQLLGGRGDNTIAAEQCCPHLVPNMAARTHPSAMRHNHDDKAKFCLMDRQEIHPLKIGMNVIGRASESDVVVRDAFVSRRHCAIMVHTDGCCELYDIASKNGTHLNGRKLSGPAKLHPGDEIRMCDFQLVFLADRQCDSSHHAATMAG